MEKLTENSWLGKLYSGLSYQIRNFSFHATTVMFVAVASLVFFIMLTQTGLGSNILMTKWVLVRVAVTTLSNIPYLPIVVLALPLVGGFFELYLGRTSDKKRDVMIVYITFITLLLIMAMYPKANDGRMFMQLNQILGLGLSFKVDMLGLTMLFITAILWFVVMVYSHDYMMHEKHRNRFYFFLSITYSAILGTIMAGDLLTMFLFFEILTFSSYMLVSHGEKRESIEAGYNYIFMGVLGGLSILLGMLLLYGYTGSVTFISKAAEFASMGWMGYAIILLLMLGFGIKAGMAPVHIWLPKAHPVAPTPASALLSGIMIKVGAFGMLRVATSYLFPLVAQVSDYKDPLWYSAKGVGSIVIWLGIITMAIGVFFALQQSNMKKMLAYHSVSQMGYIVLGIGVALYLGAKGAMGYSGALYHIINHALFKSLLFMIAGVIYLQTHELNMYKLGGLWKKMPLTALFALIAALGITGMPLFNGFASKSLLHHAIIEAYQYGHPSFRFAEIMFNVISAGTVCSFIKLFGFTFLGKLPEEYQDLKPKLSAMHLAMGAVAVMIIFVGLFPNYILDFFILPAASSLAYDPYFISKYLSDIQFFNLTDMSGMIWIYIGGAGIFYMGIKYHLFHIHFPQWLHIEYILFYPVHKVMHWSCKVMGHCSCEADVVELENSVDNPFATEESALNPKRMGLIERMVTTITVFTDRYEMSLIRSDVTIFTIVLTTILGLLYFFG